MASRAIPVNLGAAVDADGNWSATALGAAGFPDKTAFESALATLVADGASPTQAHVTAVNDAYTTYAAAVAAYTTGNLVLTFDSAVLTTSNKIKGALKAALQQLRNYGLLTD